MIDFQLAGEKLLLEKRPMDLWSYVMNYVKILELLFCHNSKLTKFFLRLKFELFVQETIKLSSIFLKTEFTSKQIF